MWDPSDWGIFVSADPEAFHTYVYITTTISGYAFSFDFLLLMRNRPAVRHVGTTMILGGIGNRLKALLACAGAVVCQEDTGVMHSIALSTHENLGSATTTNDKVCSFSRCNI